MEQAAGEDRGEDRAQRKRVNRRRKKRGSKGGVRQRLRKRKVRPPLPSIILANVQSLRNKHDELVAHTKFLYEYREASLLCLTETWLDDTIANGCLRIDGFSGPIRQDRSAVSTGKSRGGGVCVYVSERWCSDVTVKDQGCTKDIEFVSLSLRPFYLPREFGRIFLTVVYIPPDANYSIAADIISDLVQRQECVSPDAPKLILGDFNGCSLSDHLPHYTQYVDCSTRKDKTLDKCFGNIPDAYKSVRKPPLSTADHCMIHLLPAYKTKLKSSKPVVRTVKQWTRDATDTLKGEFECTLWDVFFEDSHSYSDTVDAVTSYILFNQEKTIPIKTVKFYPNNKPWVSKELKLTLKQKAAAFSKGDFVGGKTLQSTLRRQIANCKREYREKVEKQFQTGNIRQAWQGIKTMAGVPPQTPSAATPTPGDSVAEFSNQLNAHFARFEEDFSQDLAAVTEELRTKARPSDAWVMEIGEEEVEKTFRRLHTRKAVGPDGVSGKILKACCSQLASVFTRIFNTSLSSSLVPAAWKQSIIHPLPKKSRPSALNDYRPIALTSVVVKCMERLVLTRMLNQAGDRLDPLQFAYRHNRSVEDAVISVLNLIYSHLETPKAFARVLFADFSAAFNTVRPHLLAEKLINLNINPTLTLWVLNFLTDRQQCVRVNGTYSDMLTTSVGTPQGSVVSPVLYILFTNDCCSSNELQYTVKFADDTALVDLSNSDSQFEQEVDRFVTWCRNNSLQLNVGKTQEMVVDFRKSGNVPQPLVIDGQIVQRTETYKYLGTVIDSKLTFDVNTDTIFRKAQSRLYMLRKLRSFGVSAKTLKMFYFSFIESLITFSFLSWYGGLSTRNMAKLNRIVRHSEKVVGEKLQTLSSTFKVRAVKKGARIASDTSHFLSQYFKPLPSGRRLQAPFVKTKRYRCSYIPTAVRLLNETK